MNIGAQEKQKLGRDRKKKDSPSQRLDPQSLLAETEREDEGKGKERFAINADPGDIDAV